MNKDIFTQYVYLLNRLEESSSQDKKLILSEADQKLMEEVQKISKESPENYQFLEKLHSLPSSERMRAVEDNFSVKEESPKSEETEISKAFGVDVKDIRHHFLKNGHEIFYFYDPSSSRNVVLENQKKGKSLVEQLKEIQKNDEEEYQMEVSSQDTRSMLMDESQVRNMELEMQSKEEILSQNVLDNVKEEDERLLNYLLRHYDELQIESINVENMIFMDRSGNIKEASIDKDNNINIGTPSSASYGENDKQSVSEGSSFEEELEEENTNESNSEEENTNESNPEEEDDYEYEEGKTERKEKPKVFVKNRPNIDPYGYTNYALLFLLVGAVFLYLFLGIILFGRG